MDIYKRINSRLDKLNISRRQLALKINVSTSTINSAFARKSKSLSVDMISKIAIALNVPINYLLGVQPFLYIDYIDNQKDIIFPTLVNYSISHDFGKEDSIDLLYGEDETYYMLIDMYVSAIDFINERANITYKNDKVSICSYFDEDVETSKTKKDELYIISVYNEIDKESQEHLLNTARILYKSHLKDKKR